ncbi:MAG: esterase [Comamonadaceae bacterium]|nr:MAG: esterase [Comamonadaceae bacterium]
MINPALLGRLSFTPDAKAPDQPPLPAGLHGLGIAQERDALLYVPSGRQAAGPVPLLVMFHGAGGSAERVLPFVQPHADARGFLLLAPQSQFPTWDLVIGGNGPDLERLDGALAAVAARFAIDPARLAFAGFSDGGSYALSAGITNGDVASHVIVFSGGFMSVFMQHGAPRVFIAHGLADEQLPIETSARPHAARLKAAGYEVSLVEFNGPHAIQPPVVALAMDFFLGAAAEAHTDR